jgi:hypothetical protein
MSTNAAGAGQPTLREWLAGEEFHLALSSSFFGFCFHLGVLDALVSEGLLPASLSGTSSGAFVACLYAASLDLNAMKKYLFQQKNPLDFPFVLRDVVRLTAEAMAESFPPGHSDFTKFHVPAFVSAFDPIAGKNRVFQGSDCLLTSLAATMAIPPLCRPVVDRKEGRILLDGALGDIAGLEGLKDESGDFSERHVLYHHASYLPLGLCPYIFEVEQLVTLKVKGLPLLHPYNLRDGEHAFDVAKNATLNSLDLPVPLSRLVQARECKRSNL